LWGEVRRIIRRSGAIAVRSLLAAPGRGTRLGVLVASDGMGGAVPLRDGRNRVVALGWGAACSGMAFPFTGWAGTSDVTGRCWASGRDVPTEDGCGRRR
jgi:hypothetical protein